MIVSYLLPLGNLSLGLFHVTTTQMLVGLAQGILVQNGAVKTHKQEMFVKNPNCFKPT